MHIGMTSTNLSHREYFTAVQLGARTRTRLSLTLWIAESEEWSLKDSAASGYYIAKAGGHYEQAATTSKNEDHHKTSGPGAVGYY
jgi:hypothetical protein